MYVSDPIYECSQNVVYWAVFGLKSDLTRLPQKVLDGLASLLLEAKDGNHHLLGVLTC